MLLHIAATHTHTQRQTHDDHNLKRHLIRGSLLPSYMWSDWHSTNQQCSSSQDIFSSFYTWLQLPRNLSSLPCKPTIFFSRHLSGRYLALDNLAYNVTKPHQPMGHTLAVMISTIIKSAGEESKIPAQISPQPPTHSIVFIPLPV